MSRYYSATEREEKPHASKSTNPTTRKRRTSGKKARKSRRRVSVALKRRAQSVIKNTMIDGRARALIRYGLETNDPWLPELVRRAEAGESIIDARGNLVPVNA